MTPKKRGESPTDRLAVLRGNAIFRDLEPAALAKLCQHIVVQKFTRGSHIFLRGDPGSSLFGVIRGAVRMSSSSSEGKNALLNLIGAGEIFGEIAVLDGRARTTDAIANVDCEVWRIDRRDLIPFLRSEPDLSLKFIELLCARLRWTSEHLEQVILQSLAARLAHMIVKLAERHEEKDGSLTVDMTQQRVSEMVGISRESTNKLLSAWAENGWVRVEHRTLVVLNVKALKALAGQV